MKLYDGGFFDARQKVLKLIDEEMRSAGPVTASCCTLIENIRTKIEQLQPNLDALTYEELPACVRDHWDHD
jgi:hypothetical protein